MIIRAICCIWLIIFGMKCRGRLLGLGIVWVVLNCKSIPEASRIVMLTNMIQGQSFNHPPTSTINPGPDRTSHPGSSLRRPQPSHDGQSPKGPVGITRKSRRLSHQRPSKMGSPSSGPLSPPRTPPGANPTLQPSYRPQSTPDSSNTHNNQAPRILELLHAEPRTRGTRPSSPTRLGRRERATVFVFQAGMLVRHAESAVRAAQCALGVWWEELSLSPGCAGVEDADYGDGDWGEWWGG